MTINERIRDFRKQDLKLSQTEFALKIGMRQTSVSSIEKVGATVTDQTVKNICTIFNVNEEWLRNGIGDKQCAPDVFSLDKYAKDRGMSDLELGILKVYFDIDPQLRTQFLEQFLNGFGVAARKSIFDGVPNTSEELERQFPPIDVHNKTAG